MNYIYIGDLVNTHGIKGEVRIMSDFKYKDAVFKKGMKLYLGKRKEELVINTYRIHKNYDMVTFDGIYNINDVIVYKGDSVYINRDDIEVDGYFDEDIIGLDVYTDKLIGKVEYILKSKAHDILVLDNGKMIPNIPEFVKKIDLETARIIVLEVEGMTSEN